MQACVCVGLPSLFYGYSSAPYTVGNPRAYVGNGRTIAVTYQDMQISLTQMHPATFAAIAIELVMVGAQLAFWMNRPDERSRFWYLLLLVMVLACNFARGLFPGTDMDVPIHVQHRINYGLGFLTVSYFPFYFYKAFGLLLLRFHALYAAPVCFLLPYGFFFLVAYPGDMELEAATRKVIIIPFLYAIVLFWAILRAIRQAYRIRDTIRHPLGGEEMLVYVAVVPWSAVALVLCFRLGQFAETLFTNIGFLITTTILLVRSVRQARNEREQLRQIRLIGNLPAPHFGLHCTKYGLTRREIEVVAEIRKGLTNPAIAENLNISLATVKSHIEHILKKTGTDNRYMLVQKLTYGDNL